MKKTFIPLEAKHSYQLEHDKIDIYCFLLDNPLPDMADNVLSEEEKLRANRFYFKNHQHHFRSARFTLRSIIAQYLQIAPQTVRFDYKPHGKPFLPDYPTISFNLSHSGEYGVIAIGHTYPLGIDIERFSARPYLGIATHVFSAIEHATLQALPKGLQPWMFFNTWAQKEAFIKLIGLGLSYPTTKLTLDGCSRQPYHFVDPVYKNHLKILPFMPKIGYAAALCCHPSIKRYQYILYTS